jgi:HAD superfamily hydrolase (TIGR01509 family)
MLTKGVIFDMDGLMFDTERLTFEIWNEFLTKQGYEYSFDYYRQTIGKRTVEVKKFYANHYGSDFDYDSLKPTAMKMFWKYIEDKGVPIKKGLVELLEFLKSKQIKIALATSTTSESAKKLLEKADVLKYFDELICGDMVINGKPDPEVFLKASSALGLKVEECIGLEDSINGIKSLHNAKMRAIMVPDLVEPTEEIKPMLYALCKDLTEVKKYI